MIQSNIFAATINSAGIKKNFILLQGLLTDIAEHEGYLHEYASGVMFDDMINEFSKDNKDILDNNDLFGDMGQNTIATTRAVMRRIHKTMILISEALDIIETMYTKVNLILADTESEFISNEKRTENLISWALRKGLKLNNESLTKIKLVIASKSYTSPVDYWGVLDLLDNIRFRLETMYNLPAYYRTSTNADTQSIQTPVRVIYANKHESLETIALRELGSADKAQILMEFNELSYIDIHGDDWDGKKIKIPYKGQATEELQNNFVLDSHTGIKTLGKDISNTLTTNNGDFQPLGYTDTLIQALKNMIATPLGSMPESPEWGNRAISFMGSINGDITDGITGVEISRAILTDPRVEDVANVIVHTDNEYLTVSMQVKAVNNIIETELSASAGELL